MKFAQLFFISLLTALFCISNDTALHAEAFTIDNFDVVIRVHKDAYFEVQETIDLTFSEQRRGIFRNIPYEYNLNGERYDISIDNIEVEGQDFKVSQQNSNYVIRIGNPNRYINGAQRYIIRYRVRHAFIFAEAHSEFYWNLIGDGWETYIKKASFLVELPEALTLQDSDIGLYTGTYGVREQNATYEFDGTALRGATTQALAPHEALTLALRLPTTYINRPSELELLWRKYGFLALPLLIVAGFGGFVYRLWQKHGKDEPIIQAVEFYPPAELPPAEAGVLIDDTNDHRDLIALIPFWAANGYIKMYEVGKSSLLFNSLDYELEKIKDLPASVPRYEQIMFNGLFSRSNRTSINSLKNNFYTTLSSAQSNLMAYVKSQKYYTPKSSELSELIPFIAMAMIGAGALIIFFLGSVTGGIAAILCGILTFFVKKPMLRRSMHGNTLYQQLFGFRMFVKAAEKDRLERLLKEDPNYFEKTLPYALVFGYAKEWGKKFDGLLLEPPTWYVGNAYGPRYFGHGGGFSMGDFADKFEGGVRNIENAFSSTPPSKGGGSWSGGSGGGFSGGGFGGGGGGSW